jgi:hypothetical protein
MMKATDSIAFNPGFMSLKDMEMAAAHESAPEQDPAGM